MRYHIGASYQQFGTGWPGPNANSTHIARPFGQDLRYALGIGFQVIHIQVLSPFASRFSALYQFLGLANRQDGSCGRPFEQL